MADATSTDASDPSAPATDASDPATPATDASEPATPASPPRRLGLIAVVATVSLLVDQLSKHWAVSSLSDGHVVDVVGSLRFNLAYNTGVAFSMGTGRGLGPWITVLALAVVVGLSLGATSRTTVGAVAAGLIAGGAVGNLLDRAFRGDAGFLHGGVVDFIDLQWWPVFNVADACVVVGAGLLVVASFRAPAT
ncbi:MAG: signal peptidase II [Acidimicrobiales bacterium]|nr:signal peptidase II [Acidimicrobiales bacterium]HRW37206.1 signal peptidase II [Aquihabitans sp.]